MGGERADSGQCPAGETCSPETPDGLNFIGTDLGGALELGGPSPTAIGGTQEIALENDDVPLSFPYTVDDEGGQGVRFDHQNGNVVTVVGAGSFSNYLRILDASTSELFDRKLVIGAQIDRVALIPSGLETVPTSTPVVYAAGPVDIVVALFGQVQESAGPTDERVVDTSMIASLADATQPAWDTLAFANASAGDYAMTITAGNLAARSLTVTTVDGADAIAQIDPSSTLAPGDDICFAATNAGRYVANLKWSFTVDDAAEVGVGNCISPDIDHGTVNVTASAGGQTATVSMTVVQAAKRRERATTRSTTAGERAAM
ncbi:MAG TPA: hypothetical protein VH143_06910 [Kofleriaceae bacterium]|jgi:hypothetical protein|nr:hypothetical protein [Kofleriaceae bacterium]